MLCRCPARERIARIFKRGLPMNLTETIHFMRGALLSPQPNAQDYLARGYDWKQTALTLTLPLIVLQVIASSLSLIIAGFFSLNFVITGLVTIVLGYAVATVTLAALAGAFGGMTNFDRALGAISLAAVPSVAAAILAALLGFVSGALTMLITLAGVIYTLVILYQIIPSYLSVPEDKRMFHFIAMIVTIIVIMVVLSNLFGPAHYRLGYLG
jgi:hypothetical protein